MLNFYDGHKVYMNGDYPAIFVDGNNVHVHRLEWEKHYSSIPDGCIVHHKDGDKTNWDISNLELLTRSEHINHHRKDLMTDSFYRCGEDSRHHVLSQEDVDYIRSVYKKYDKNFGGRALSKMFNVTESCISMIVRGVSWTEGSGVVC